MKTESVDAFQGLKMPDISKCSTFIGREKVNRWHILRDCDVDRQTDCFHGQTTKIFRLVTSSGTFECPIANSLVDRETKDASKFLIGKERLIILKPHGRILDFRLK
jgi:hypothetical protein